MNLGFDIDGVLYPFHEVVYNYCHRDLGMKLTYDEFWYNIINDKFSKQENLFITNNGDKAKYIVDHKIEVFVEDRDKNALELKDYTKVILVKKLWNESIRDQFLCVDSVLELPSVLENLKGSKV